MHRLPLATCLLLCLLSLLCRADYTTWGWFRTTTESTSTASTTWNWFTGTTAEPASTASATSTISPWPTRYSTTGESTPSTVPPSQLVDQCKCTDKNIWLDIYFLMDASYAMTSPGFDGATAFIQSALSKMTLGQDYAQQTRAGGIQLAIESFNSEEHRPNAQKVIVVVASAYE
ncbi:hypothetical protein OSTOST_05289 [Ostertagia ostertagi]